MEVVTLQKSIGSTGAGVTKEVMPRDLTGLPTTSYLRSFQATLVGGGSATVKFQVSNDEAGWIDLATVTLTGGATESEGFSCEVPWKFVRSNITAVATGVVTTTMGL